MRKINYKKWAFYFTMGILFVNIISFYLVVDYVDFPGVENNTKLNLFYLRILGVILLLMSILFITFSTIEKEQKNYEYWISIIGIILFGILPLVGSFF